MSHHEDEIELTESERRALAALPREHTRYRSSSNARSRSCARKGW